MAIVLKEQSQPKGQSNEIWLPFLIPQANLSKLS
jgi:hypothetical protein